jgi:hypothetical protein
MTLRAEQSSILSLNVSKHTQIDWFLGSIALSGCAGTRQQSKDCEQNTPEAPDENRERTLSSSARGDTTDPHGPSNDC